MSKSVDRVHACLAEHGVPSTIHDMGKSTRTAVEAASEIGCDLNQIVKSMVFTGRRSGAILMFLTAGGKRISMERAEEVAGEPISRADPNTVRRKTGFSIGGVAPIGHISNTRKYIDRSILEFRQVWAAAGSPTHVFSIDPNDLVTLFGAHPADFVE